MKKQTQKDNKKRKILLATLIPLGTIAVASAITLPLVLKNNGEPETEKTANVQQDGGWAELHMTIDTPTIKNSEGENIIKLSNVYSGEGEDFSGHLLVCTSLEGVGEVARISFTVPGTGTGTPPASAQITISDWSKITSGSTLYVSFTTE